MRPKVKADDAIQVRSWHLLWVMEPTNVTEPEMSEEAQDRCLMTRGGDRNCSGY